MCSERVVSEEGSEDYSLLHPKFLRNLDGRLVEALCIDGWASEEEIDVECLREGLSFGNVKTLILSLSAVAPCLSALDEDPGTSSHSRWFLPICTLIIHPGPKRCRLCEKVLRSFLGIAQKRKAAGFPFRSFSPSLRSDQEWDGDVVLGESSG